ncbi:aldo/keto reductase [Elusimicrobiota bacterium]
MKTKKLGRTDLHLSVIGLGAWAMGGGNYIAGWGAQDDNESISTIKHALDLGINWIDTAPVYGFGHSETVVGKALVGIRGKAVIATKCSRVWDPSGKISGNLKKDNLRREIEASLKRLNTDYIDLYQIHWPDPAQDIEEAWTVVNGFIKEGKVRYGGVSNFSIKQMRRIALLGKIASAQPPYNMIKRSVEDGLLEYCSAEDIGVIVYSPMQAGLLTGKFSKERVDGLPADDWRKTSSYFNDPELGANLDLVEGLKGIIAGRDWTLSQFAIAWTLRRREVTSAIVGARNPAQIEEAALAAGKALAGEDISQIETLLDARKYDLRKRAQEI